MKSFYSGNMQSLFLFGLVFKSTFEIHISECASLVLSIFVRNADKHFAVSQKFSLQSFLAHFFLLNLNYPLPIDFTNSDDVPILLCDTKQLISCHFFAKIHFNLVVHNLCFVENLTCSSFYRTGTRICGEGEE